MRLKSIKDLGKGSWKIASITPLKKTQASKKLVSGNDPQSILLHAVLKRWPHVIPECPAGVPGRKFRIDLAFVERKVGVEIDGWEFHAKHLEDFKRDRRRQNLLVIHGWRMLRFTAADIHKDLDGCLDMIAIGIEC